MIQKIYYRIQIPFGNRFVTSAPLVTEYDPEDYDNPTEELILKRFWMDSQFITLYHPNGTNYHFRKLESFRIIPLTRKQYIRGTTKSWWEWVSTFF